MLTMVARISPYPIPELKEVSRPLRPHLPLLPSSPVLEGYATGSAGRHCPEKRRGYRRSGGGLVRVGRRSVRWRRARMRRPRSPTDWRDGDAGHGGDGCWSSTRRASAAVKSVGVAHQHRVRLGRPPTARWRSWCTAPRILIYAWPALGQAWHLPVQRVRTRSAGRPLDTGEAQLPHQLVVALLLLDQARAAGILLPWWWPMPATATTPTFSMGLDQRQAAAGGVASDFGVRRRRKSRLPPPYRRPPAAGGRP